MNHWYLEKSRQLDEGMRDKATQRQLTLTKPPGSLGRLESVAVRLSAMQGRSTPSADKVEIAVFAGDHGVANEGVSAFPQVVTMEMVKNFIRGGAAISVMARQLNAGLTVVNAGTISEQKFGPPVVDRPIGKGTGNIVIESAMNRRQCLAALQLGKDIVAGFDQATVIVIGGDMGIANTTSATALAVAYGVADAPDLVGPGTGLDAQGVQRKLTIVERAVARVGGNNDAPGLLAELGGFEIAALTGYFIHAAQRGMTILVDGFISSAAALAACKINPSVREWMLFAHTSAEPGHEFILQALAADPLLSLEMRLGEGSGSAVAVSLLRSACALQNEMATFVEAQVSDRE